MGQKLIKHQSERLKLAASIAQATNQMLHEKDELDNELASAKK